MEDDWGTKMLKELIDHGLTTEEYLDIYYEGEPHRRKMHNGHRRIKYSRKMLRRKK